MKINSASTERYINGINELSDAVGNLMSHVAALREDLDREELVEELHGILDELDELCFCARAFESDTVMGMAAEAGVTQELINR